MKLKITHAKIQKADYLLYLVLFSFFVLVLISIPIPRAFATIPQTRDPSVSSAKILKLAYCQYMPFYFEGLNKKPRGILVDIWKQWSLKTGIPVEFVLLPWDDSLQRVKDGTVDINGLMYKTQDREKDFDFSQSFFNLTTYLYYRSDTGVNVTGLKDVARLKTGVVAKDFSVEILKTRLPGLVPKRYQNHEDLVQAALNGEIQVFLMEGPIASTYLAKHDGQDLIRKLSTPLYTKPLYAGVRQGNHSLINTINKGLLNISHEEIQQIIQNWTGTGEPLVWQPYTGKIKIAASIDNMPFHFADENGQAVGMFVDLWKLWAEKTGIKVEFTTVPWAKSLAMVKNGKADVHAGCFFSVQRDTYLDYADVIRNCETHFFFHESIFGLKNLEDLKGFKIGLLDQDYAVEFVNRELPEAALKKYNSHKELFAGVEKGEVRVFICDTPTALYFLKKEKLLSSFRYHPAHPLYKKPFYAAVKEGNIPLILQINKGLAAISPEERAVIERQWMGISDIKFKNVLVIGAARNFPPFSMLNAEGKPSGLFIDMWELWSKKNGKPIAFRLYDRTEAVNALKDGIIDILSTLPPKNRIKGWMDYTAPYYRFDWYLYQTLDAIESNNTAPLAGQPLGVVAGTRVQEWAKQQLPDISLIEYETTREMVIAAVSGNIQSFIALPQEMAIIPGRIGLPGLFKPGDRPVFRQQMGAGVRNYNPNLVQSIDKGFEAISNAEMVKVENRWIGEKNARFFAPHNEQLFFSPAEKIWMARHRSSGQKIRLGVMPDWPPFEFLTGNDTYKGMVSDYVALLNQRLGLNMSVEKKIHMPQVRNELIPSSRKIDVMPSAISFHPPSPHMIRTRPYLSFPWVIINKRQTQLIVGLRDLYGKSVAVVDQYAIRTRIEKDHPEIHITPVESVVDGLDAVTSGRADAYVGNLAVVGYHLQEKNDTTLKVAASTDYKDSSLTFSVRRDWPELVTIFNKGISVISDQEHDAIRQKWFSIRFEHGVTAAYIRGLLLKIGFGALILLGLFLFWNRQIRRREERFRCLTEHGTDIIQAFSPNGTIIYQSPSFTTILGYETKALVGTSVFELLHPSDIGAWKTMIKRLLKKESSESVVHRFCDAKNQYLFFESHCINLTHNKALKAIVLNGREITERLHAEKEMQKAKELAENANLTKSDFLASLSHEIRTPLNAILGMTDITLNTPLTRNQADNLITVKESARHLLGVITDILDFSTIEAGKMRIQNQAFCLTDLLSTLELTWAFQANEKGLKFSMKKSDDTPLHIKSDPVRLRQILGNLISNAIKFTLSGKISVTVCLLENPDPDHISLFFGVKDTGIGIEQERQERIFERFTQAQTSITREYGGTGLGLAICKEVAKLMGGTISVTSNPGKGSFFSLILPFETVTALEIQALKSTPSVVSSSPKATEKSHGLTLLLVEDDKLNARVFKEFLSTTQHRIIHSPDGADSIEKLKHHDIDIVFMDIEMPRLDGLSACRKIRKGEAGLDNASIPVIAMTAHVLDEFKEKSKKAGMNGFIPKPVDMFQLQRIIEKHIPLSRTSTKPEDRFSSVDPSILDRKKALASLGGNQPLLESIYDIFINETPSLLTALKKALDKDNLSEIFMAAHTLKGAAARIFATECRQKAFELEAAAKKKDLKKAISLARETLAVFESVIELLNSRPGKVTSSEQGE